MQEGHQFGQEGGQGQEAPPPPRISGGEAFGGPQGKSLLHHFCEQAALQGRSLAKVSGGRWVTVPRGSSCW